MSSTSASELCAPSAAIVPENSFSNDGKTHIQADNVKSKEGETSLFNGDVVIQGNDKRIESDTALYNKKTEDLFVNGNVKIITPTIKISSDSAKANLNKDTALISQSKFQNMNSRGHGYAKNIELSSDDITQLKHASYTTCDEKDVVWELQAKNITLNNETQQGTASHAVLRIKDIPVFYFPYFRFSLSDKRLSGFLFPYIGTSDANGLEIKTPYYWNIHPQADATITPWYMSNRGTLLHTEFRYLTKTNSGVLISERLAQDRITNSDRQRWHWQHESNPGLGWNAKAEYNYVADKQHIIDFDDDITSSSVTYLVRAGDVSYNMANWLLTLKAENHQILSGEKPYKRLPQVTFNSRYPVINNAFNYAFQSEAVHFQHDDNKVIGQRVYIKPSVSHPMETDAGFLIPKISLHHTQYNLEQTIDETSLSRTVPTFSLNSGLFFERDSNLFDSPYLQTLEPQLFYVYVPYQEQSNLPIFDTSNYAFNVNQFFTDYRFNGIDRIGDDNRLTAALTSRLIHQEDGHELFKARIGQIYYFADRKVQLDNINDVTASSHIITELQLNPNKWTLLSQIEWEADFNKKIISNHQVGYNDNWGSVNIAQRYQVDQLATREVKANWDINSRWQTIFSNLYDLNNNHIIENLLGVNYENCCWSINFSLKERYLSENQFERGFYFGFTLTGLGGITI